MNVYEMIQEKPHLHVFGDGTPRLMSLLDNALKWMADELSTKTNAMTLETGYGLTTVLMTMLAQRHYSIAPDEAGYKRVVQYCENKGIPTKGLHYVVGRSEDVLPSLAIQDESLDLVLIDGGHGFPTPFVDYAYTFKKLKVGGDLVVDDIQLVTGMMLKDFLLKSEEWKLIGFFDGKTCVLKKETSTDGKDWSRQPYMTQMNDEVKELLYGRGKASIETIRLGPMIASPQRLQQEVPHPAWETNVLLPQTVLKRLNRLLSEDNVVQMAIFGAGKHTEWLEKILMGQDGIPQVKVVLDDFPDDKPERFGLKPIRAQDFDPHEVDAIVLSSDCFQNKMRERCLNLYGHAVRLVDLYEGLPPGPYHKP